MATSLYKFQVALKTCEEHENEELSCFCKTCKTFICTTCAKTTHHGHEWDFIPIVAKRRRKEIPILCRKIKQENMPRCREKLRAVDLNISEVEKASDDDLKKLEVKRTVMINTINQIIDEQKSTRIAIKEKKSKKFEEDRAQLRLKIKYVDKMTTSLDGNIDAYTDFDVIEMELDMLKALTELEAYDMDRTVTEMTFVPGEINRASIVQMIGRIEKTPNTNVDESASVKEVKTFNEFDELITSIVQTSRNQACVADNGSNGFTIKQLSLQNMETISVTLPPHAGFITLTNGDFIVTGYQEIQRVTSSGKVSDIVSTKPLHPFCISKTQAGDILVSLNDDAEPFELQPSSRRLVQRMTLTGKVFNTYEFRVDGKTRLFTCPMKMTENGNSDICIINRKSDDTRELIVLHGDGRVRAIYLGQEDSDLEFAPYDVACDSKNRIIVTDANSKCLHLLSPDVTFLRFLLSDLLDYPTAISLHQGSMWIGFVAGTVKVYKYTE